jgi:hypothetical protein
MLEYEAEDRLSLEQLQGMVQQPMRGLQRVASNRHSFGGGVPTPLKENVQPRAYT